MLNYLCENKCESLLANLNVPFFGHDFYTEIKISFSTLKEFLSEITFFILFIIKYI